MRITDESETYLYQGTLEPSMRIEVRPLVAVGVLFIALALLIGGSTIAGALTGVSITETESEPEIETIELEDGSEIWPYTSRSASVSDRTLALNFIVHGDAAVTRQLLQTEGFGETTWEEMDENETDVAPAEETLNQSGLGLGEADGAVRYTYVEDPDGNGHWLDESYQLKDGTYLGARDHLRAYEDPHAGKWTVFQGHSEHWDWFQIRHNVHSIESTQSKVELHFVDNPLVEDLVRERWGNDRGSDSDGWITSVDLDEEFATILLGAVLIASIQTARMREFIHDEDVKLVYQGAFVVASLVALMVFVRFGAIWAEGQFPNIYPNTIAVVFYPFLVFGMPIAVYLTARPLDRLHAFAAGSSGFFIALLVDYTYLQVTALPLDTLLQHVTLAIALGVIAAGASTTARDPKTDLGYVRTGALLWAVAIVMPLLVHVPIL